MKLKMLLQAVKYLTLIGLFPIPTCALLKTICDKSLNCISHSRYGHMVKRQSTFKSSSKPRSWVKEVNIEPGLKKTQMFKTWLLYETNLRLNQVFFLCGLIYLNPKTFSPPNKANTYMRVAISRQRVLVHTIYELFC